jgi:RNA polymerase sigma-70 factor (ECF subfamily)
MASLDNLLAILPEQQRKIFMMSRHDGFSNQEIAEKLEISIRTVENQIYRASKFIKENLKEDYIILVLILAGVYIR